MWSKREISGHKLLAAAILLAVPFFPWTNIVSTWLLQTKAHSVAAVYARDGCPDWKYTVELLNLDPVMFYLNGFLSVDEANYIKKSANFSGRVFAGSMPIEDGKSPLSASVSKYDPVVRCVGRRAMNFLGFYDSDEYESPWVARYQELGQKIHLHLDPDPSFRVNNATGQPYNWLTSFFIYLDGDSCEGGGTYFPNIKAPVEKIDADEQRTASQQDWLQPRFSVASPGQGLIVNPKKGNGIFWQSMYENKTRHDGSLHGGLPVVRCKNDDHVKIGMNVWARQYSWKE